jgi:hypothetical protein
VQPCPCIFFSRFLQTFFCSFVCSIFAALFAAIFAACLQQFLHCSSFCSLLQPLFAAVSCSLCSLLQPVFAAMAVTFQLRAEGLGQLVARSLQLGLVLLCVLGGLSSLPSTEYFLFSRLQPVSQPAPVVCLLPVCMPILGNASGCMEGFPQPALSWSRAGWDPGQLRRRGGQYPDWAPPPSFADGPPWPHNSNFSFTPKFPGGVGSAELAKFLASSRSPPATPLAGESLAVSPAARQQPLTGELLLKFLVDFRPTLATEPMVVQGVAQPAQLSSQQPAQFSACVSSNLSVCLATGTIAVVAPVPAISWLGRILHISAQLSAFRAAQQHVSPAAVPCAQQWQEFSPAAGTQWFSNQAAAAAQLFISRFTAHFFSGSAAQYSVRALQPAHRALHHSPSQQSMQSSATLADACDCTGVSFSAAS